MKNCLGESSWTGDPLCTQKMGDVNRLSFRFGITKCSGRNEPMLKLLFCFLLLLFFFFFLLGVLDGNTL